MSDLKNNPKGGSFKTGVWIQRIMPHSNCPEMGYLTQGKSYQVMSPDYYSNSKAFKNKCGNPIADADTKLARDCVMLRDDQGKIGLFAARQFRLTSGVKKASR